MCNRVHVNNHIILGGNQSVTMNIAPVKAKDQIADQKPKIKQQLFCDEQPSPPFPASIKNSFCAIIVF